jgi:hypothetical protein
VGSHEPFEIKARGLVPKAAGRAARKPEPPPDRSRLDAAEKALGRLEEAFNRDAADKARRLEALRAEQETMRRKHTEEKKAAQAELKAARAAYRRGGGRT